MAFQGECGASTLSCTTGPPVPFCHPKLFSKRLPSTLMLSHNLCLLIISYVGPRLRISLYPGANTYRTPDSVWTVAHIMVDDFLRCRSDRPKQRVQNGVFDTHFSTTSSWMVSAQCALCHHRRWQALATQKSRPQLPSRSHRRDFYLEPMPWWFLLCGTQKPNTKLNFTFLSAKSLPEWGGRGSG